MKLDDIEKLDRERTPGHWWTDCDEMLFVRCHSNRYVVCKPYTQWAKEDIADVAFIAACSDMVTRMVKALKLVKEHIAWADDFDSASLIPVELRIAMAELGQP